MNKLAISLLLACSCAIGGLQGCSKENNVDASTHNNYVTNNYVTQVIGPSGGFVENPSGARVDIPANALTQDVSISVGDVESGGPTIPSGYVAVSKTHVFEPHGHTFAADVVVTIPQNSGGKSVILMRAEEGGGFDVVAPSEVLATRVHLHTSSFSLFVVVQPEGGAGGAAGSAGSAGSAGNAAGGAAGSGDSGADAAIQLPHCTEEPDTVCYEPERGGCTWGTMVCKCMAQADAGLVWHCEEKSYCAGTVTDGDSCGLLDGKALCVNKEGYVCSCNPYGTGVWCLPQPK